MNHDFTFVYIMIYLFPILWILSSAVRQWRHIDVPLPAPVLANVPPVLPVMWHWCAAHSTSATQCLTSVASDVTLMCRSQHQCYTMPHQCCQWCHIDVPLTAPVLHNASPVLPVMSHWCAAHSTSATQCLTSVASDVTLMCRSQHQCYTMPHQCCQWCHIDVPLTAPVLHNASPVLPVMSHWCAAHSTSATQCLTSVASDVTLMCRSQHQCYTMPHQCCQWCHTDVPLTAPVLHNASPVLPVMSHWCAAHSTSATQCLTSVASDSTEPVPPKNSHTQRDVA